MPTKRSKCGLAILLLIALLIPGSLFAANTVTEFPLPPGFQSGDQVILPAEETIEGPVFYSGQNVQINGNVNGTTFASGATVDVNGRIEGDLFVAAQDVTIRGEVTGNIYAGGQSIQFDNETHGDIFAGGQTLRFTETAKANRDAFLGSPTVNSDGLIGRHLFIGSESANLGGNVGGDVYISSTIVNLKEGANIEGNLNYESRQKIEVPPGATVAGEQNWKELTRSSTDAMSEQEDRSISRIVLGILFSLISATLIWLVVELIRPRYWHHFVDPLMATPVKTIGFGLLAALVLIPLIILMSITVVGIPAALLLLGISVILTALAKIITAMALSRIVIERYHFPAIHMGVWSFMLMYLALILLARIPYLGILVHLICIFIAFGIVVLYLFLPPYRTRRPGTPPASSNLPPSTYTPLPNDPA